MRRAAIVLAALAAVAAGVFLIARPDGTSSYRVAAIFDTAKGMVGGQQVKIAGAVVGKVEKVELAPGPKARVIMRVDRRFHPFSADASCRILPEGPISENYIDCDPGSPARPPLRRGPAGVPTVGVKQTSVPVSLQDVINVFSLPTDQRIQILLGELGLATAGRGEDLNAILRRANPALAQSRRVLAIVDEQRERLADGVAQTDRVLGELAERDESVRRFVDRAAVVAETGAERRSSLEEAVRRLPPMLQAVRPGLRSLDRAMVSGSPLLASLRAAAPAARTLMQTLPAFSEAGVPALRALSSMARRGRTAVRSARPVVDALHGASLQASPFADKLDSLLVSMRDRGALEGLMWFLYAYSSALGAYDGVSHMFSIYAGVYPQCVARGAAEPGCSHAYNAPGGGKLPVNDPGCGPQIPSVWSGDPNPCSGSRARRSAAAREPAARQPARRRTRGAAAHSPQPSEPLSALLDYLLK